jgi:hypothetical protein
MSAKLNYYKFRIRTSDGTNLYNVIEYQGLFLGQIQNPSNPHSQKLTQQFALIKYGDTQTQTLWQGEITNFDPGYNLEIFQIPESLGDYLVFTHPISNMAGSHCYWLKQDGICTEIQAAQTKLIGLKYTYYHSGRFIGVFHWLTTQRIHIGHSHRITIGEINISVGEKQGQQTPKQIGINVIHTATLHDLASIYSVRDRICGVIPAGEDCIVFRLNLSVQVKYYILTHELTATTDVIEFLQPDGTLLNEWDAQDMPPNPVYNVLYAAPITGTLDFMVKDTWANKLYIYKQSDKRFHMITHQNELPLFSYVSNYFLTPNLAIVTHYGYNTGEYCFSLEILDYKTNTFKIIARSYFEHLQSISVLSCGSILLNNCLFEPILTSPTNRADQPPTLAEKTINRVVNALSSTTDTASIAQPIAELIGKFILLRSSHVRAVATLTE